MRSQYNGLYLVTHSQHKFLGATEIFLLLQSEDDIRGYCVNAYTAHDDDRRFESDSAEAKRLGDLSEAFKKGGFSISEPSSLRPLCFGGPDGDGECLVIHTGPGDFKNMRSYLRLLYHVTPFADFLADLAKNTPIIFSFFAGYQRFSQDEIDRACRAGDWSLRIGCHHMTYGDILAAKSQFIDRFPVRRQPSSPNPMELMSIIFDSIKALIHERQITMTRMTVYFYFSEISKVRIDSHHADRTTRFLLALAETEGKDIAQIMETYTHQEMYKKFRELSADGIELKLVKAFEDRQAMLAAIGLDSIQFDRSHYAAILDGMNSGDGNHPPERVHNVRRFENKMEQIAALIKDSGVSEG